MWGDSPNEGCTRKDALPLLRPQPIVLRQSHPAQEQVVHFVLVEAQLQIVLSRAVDEPCVGGGVDVASRLVVVEHIVEHLLLAGKQVSSVLIVFHSLDVLGAQLPEVRQRHLAVLNVETDVGAVDSRDVSRHGVHVQLWYGKTEQQVNAVVARIALFLVGQIGCLVAIGDDAVSLHGHLFEVDGLLIPLQRRVDSGHWLGLHRVS